VQQSLPLFLLVLSPLPDFFFVRSLFFFWCQRAGAQRPCHPRPQLHPPGKTAFMRFPSFACVFLVGSGLFSPLLFFWPPGVRARHREKKLRCHLSSLFSIQGFVFFLLFYRSLSHPSATARDTLRVLFPLLLI